MEPGHEDREYPRTERTEIMSASTPQWSPVMKTGNTPHERLAQGRPRTASMEPGHEDREYIRGFCSFTGGARCLNGARS